MKDPVAIAFEEQLDAIHTGIGGSLERLGALEPAKAAEAFGLILSYACQTTFWPATTVGREHFDRLDPEWVRTHLFELLPQFLNLADEWEYRRLLELLSENYQDLVDCLCEMGAGSSDPYIRGAAEEYRST